MDEFLARALVGGCGVALAAGPLGWFRFLQACQLHAVHHFADDAQAPPLVADAWTPQAIFWATVMLGNRA